MVQFVGLDIETAPVEGFPAAYALQPWRAIEGRARITSMAVVMPDGTATLSTHREAMQQQLDGLKGMTVAAWNAIFDVAWLIASGLSGAGSNWIDAMHLWKWVDNSQEMELSGSWSLLSGVKRWCKDEPWYDEFISMKTEDHSVGSDDGYWEYRASLDARAAARIAEIVWPLLTSAQQRAAKIEAMCIPPVAKSWVRGIRTDAKNAASRAPTIVAEMYAIEKKLGLVTPPTKYAQDRRAQQEVVDVDDETWEPTKVMWVPSKIIASPKQLGSLLYGTWGLNVAAMSDKTGAPSTDKAAMTYLADHDDRVLQLLRWRELNTQRSKFIEGIAKSTKYLNSPTVHPQPAIFSTYTGRMTYRSKSGSKGALAKAYIGIPIHQFPRPKDLRRLIKPPKGKVLAEWDASGQESRLMAIQSGDKRMMEVFQNKLDIHSYMGAELAGMTYEAFMRGKAEGNEHIVGPHGLRMQGKFTNLSCNYRIGVKKLRVQARVQYDMDVSWDTAKRWQDTFHRAYPSIKDYWQDAIYRAQTLGYAETIAGRRFALTMWHVADMQWATESSAINFPIQGSGGDMKELGLAVITKRFPQVEFGFDLHDGLYGYIDERDDVEATVLEVRDALDNLPYKDAWHWEPPIPLPWDASYGLSWGDKKEL